jgi:hypothetical protein
MQCKDKGECPKECTVEKLRVHHNVGKEAEEDIDLSP